MDLRKRLAIEVAGIKVRFPCSPHEPSLEQRFDRMWPSEQRRFLDRADRILRAMGGRHEGRE